jgi:hypothetical protein
VTKWVDIPILPRGEPNDDHCDFSDDGSALFSYKGVAHRNKPGTFTFSMDATKRPRLKNCVSKHYHPSAEKALPAVVLGIIARVGSVNGQRVALISDLVQADPVTPGEAQLQGAVVRRTAETLAENEIAVFDAGFKVRELQAERLPRYLVRLVKNFTARRNVLPAYKGHGRRPEYGELVRPLARTHKGKRVPATASDRVETWTENGLTFRAEFWDNLVLPDVKVHPDHPTFSVAAIYDPRFREPWLLACPLQLSGAALRGLYRDRWPVEQVPLAAKQMLGGARQFVFAPESCQRLPELNLLAGSIVTYLAAVLPAAPTGFWDRNPKPTPGRLRRLLTRTPFPQVYPFIPSCSLAGATSEKGLRLRPFAQGCFGTSAHKTGCQRLKTLPGVSIPALFLAQKPF